MPSLVLLNDYDTGNVPIPKGDESQWVLTYEDAMLFIRSMPYMPITVVFANSFAHGAENAYIWLLLFAVGRAWVSVSGSIPVRKNNRVRDYGR